MTDQQKHVARLREMAAASRTKADKFKIHNVGEWFDKYMAEADTFDAGAEALEAQGAWYLVPHFGQQYMIPVERKDDWLAWLKHREPGEYTAIVPEWAKPVPDDVVITGWRV